MQNNNSSCRGVKRFSDSIHLDNNALGQSISDSVFVYVDSHLVCKLCNLTIDDRLSSINDHINSKFHQQQQNSERSEFPNATNLQLKYYQKYKQNKITIHNDSMFCTICHSTIAAKEHSINRHLNCPLHKKNMVNFSEPLPLITNTEFNFDLCEFLMINDS